MLRTTQTKRILYRTLEERTAQVRVGVGVHIWARAVQRWGGGAYYTRVYVRAGAGGGSGGFIEGPSTLQVLKQHLDGYMDLVTVYRAPDMAQENPTSTALEWLPHRPRQGTKH